MSKTKNQPKVNIVAHYTKSINFDSVKAPDEITQDIQPKVDVSIDVATNNKKDDLHEVMLDIKAKITQEDDKIFNLSLQYIGLCILNDVSEEDDQKAKILNIYCPNMIFPFARRVIADVTRDGGYQPMLINGVDFAGMYAKKNPVYQSDTVM